MLRLVLVIHWLLLMLDVITMDGAAENTDSYKVHMDGVKVIIIIYCSKVTCPGRPDVQCQYYKLIISH